MLSRIIVNVYAVLLEVGLWFLLLVGAIAGYSAKGFFGAIFGIVSAAIFGAVFFGAFLVLNDIRDRVKAIENRKST